MRYSFIFILAFFTLSLAAQESQPKNKFAPIFFEEDRLLVTFSSDNWSGLPDSIESKPFRSRGFSFLFMSDNMNKKGNFGFGFGLGFMSQNVHTDSRIDTLGNASALFKIPDSLNYKLNKLSLNFITAALELRIRSGENKAGDTFRLSAGFLAGFMLQNHVKYKDKYGKLKIYDIDNLEKFQYGVTGRIGFNHYALSVYYALSQVFEDKKGPELTPYSIGISFTF